MVQIGDSLHQLCPRRFADEGKAFQNILVREALASNLPQVKSAPRSFALLVQILLDLPLNEG